MVSMVLQLEGTDDSAHYTTIHENSNHMLKTSLLDTKKVAISSMKTCKYYACIYMYLAIEEMFSICSFFLNSYMYSYDEYYNVHMHVTYQKNCNSKISKILLSSMLFLPPRYSCWTFTPRSMFGWERCLPQS